MSSFQEIVNSSLLVVRNLTDVVAQLQSYGLKLVMLGLTVKITWEGFHMMRGSTTYGGLHIMDLLYRSVRPMVAVALACGIGGLNANRPDWTADLFNGFQVQVTNIIREDFGHVLDPQVDGCTPGSRANMLIDLTDQAMEIETEMKDAEEVKTKADKRYAKGLSMILEQEVQTNYTKYAYLTVLYKKNYFPHEIHDPSVVEGWLTEWSAWSQLVYAAHLSEVQAKRDIAAEDYKVLLDNWKSERDDALNAGKTLKRLQSSFKSVTLQIENFKTGMDTMCQTGDILNPVTSSNMDWLYRIIDVHLKSSYISILSFGATWIASSIGGGLASWTVLGTGAPGATMSIMSTITAALSGSVLVSVAYFMVWLTAGFGCFMLQLEREILWMLAPLFLVAYALQVTTGYAEAWLKGMIKNTLSSIIFIIIFLLANKITDGLFKGNLLSDIIRIALSFWLFTGARSMADGLAVSLAGGGTHTPVKGHAEALQDAKTGAGVVESISAATKKPNLDPNKPNTGDAAGAPQAAGVPRDRPAGARNE